MYPNVALVYGRSMLKFGLFCLAIALGVYLLLCGLLFVFQRNLLYLPSREMADLAQHPGSGLRSVSVPDRPGSAMTHWFRPPAAADGTVVVLFHGNAGHIGHRVSKFAFLLEQGHGLLLVGYPGYGGNPGQPSQESLLAAGRAALQWLAGEGIAADRVLLYGESLGSAVTVILAAEQAQRGGPYAGVTLEAPFTAISDVAAHHYWYVPARWLLRDPWDAGDVVEEIAAPLLVIHGRRDRTVPFVFGERLFALARDPKQALFLDRASHNDLYDDPAVPAAVLSFIGEARALAATR